jgi:hypothetical protein
MLILRKKNLDSSHVRVLVTVKDSGLDRVISNLQTPSVCKL